MPSKGFVYFVICLLSGTDRWAGPRTASSLRLAATVRKVGAVRFRHIGAVADEERRSGSSHRASHTGAPDDGATLDELATDRHAVRSAVRHNRTEAHLASSERRAFSKRRSSKLGRMRGPASTRITRASRGSRLRKSREWLLCKLRDSAAISTPVGPPPTTKLRGRPLALNRLPRPSRRRAGSCGAGRSRRR